MKLSGALTCAPALVLDQFSAEIVKRVAPLRSVFPEWNQGNKKHDEPFRLNLRPTLGTRIFSTIDLRAYAVESIC